MIKRLFVYGSLAPGETNHGVMSQISGKWQSAHLQGNLINPNWRTEGGYPSFELNQNADWVQGMIFSSDHLPDHWSRLDAFEGQGYVRSAAIAKTRDNQLVEVFVYVHNHLNNHIDTDSPEN